MQVDHYLEGVLAKHFRQTLQLSFAGHFAAAKRPDLIVEHLRLHVDHFRA